VDGVVPPAGLNDPGMHDTLHAVAPAAPDECRWASQLSAPGDGDGTLVCSASPGRQSACRCHVPYPVMRVLPRLVLTMHAHATLSALRPLGGVTPGNHAGQPAHRRDMERRDTKARANIRSCQYRGVAYLGSPATRRAALQYW
jgi:hypothetical protein